MVEIFDLQQDFLDHTMRRAGERGLVNVVPTQGDATALPYEDGSVDAVVLTAVLGELFGDPHFTTLASLRRQAGERGFAYQSHSGNWFAFFARLSPS